MRHGHKCDLLVILRWRQYQIQEAWPHPSAIILGASGSFSCHREASPISLREADCLHVLRGETSGGITTSLSADPIPRPLRGIYRLHGLVRAEKRNIGGVDRCGRVFLLLLVFRRSIDPSSEDESEPVPYEEFPSALSSYETYSGVSSTITLLLRVVVFFWLPLCEDEVPVRSMVP